MRKKQETSLALLAIIMMVIAGIYMDKMQMDFVPSLALKALSLFVVVCLGAIALHSTRIPKNDP